MESFTETVNAQNWAVEPQGEKNGSCEQGSESSGFIKFWEILQ
jgi:hypothetical protein